MKKQKNVQDYLFKTIAYGVTFLVAGYLLIYAYFWAFPGSTPQFFPLDSPNATYSIAECGSTNQLYCLTYLNEIDEPNGFGIDTVIVSSPEIDLAPYLELDIVSIDGEFVSSSELTGICYPDGCVELGDRVVLLIDDITVREEE